LAAREKSRAVRSRKYLCVDRDRTHFSGSASVNALAGIQNLRPKRVVLDVADEIVDVLGVVREFGEKLRGDVRLHFLDRLDARVLLFAIQRVGYVALRQ